MPLEAFTARCMALLAQARHSCIVFYSKPSNPSIHSNYSFIHSFIHSFIQSFIHSLQSLFLSHTCITNKHFKDSTNPIPSSPSSFSYSSFAFPAPRLSQRQNGYTTVSAAMAPRIAYSIYPLHQTTHILPRTNWPDADSAIPEGSEGFPERWTDHAHAPLPRPCRTRTRTLHDPFPGSRTGEESQSRSSRTFLHYPSPFPFNTLRRKLLNLNRELHINIETLLRPLVRNRHIVHISADNPLHKFVLITNVINAVHDGEFVVTTDVVGRSIDSLQKIDSSATAFLPSP